MTSEWSQATLGSIAINEGYGLVDGPFGSNLPASLYTDEGVPVIRGSNLALGTSRFRAQEFVFVSWDTAKRLARSLCRPLDIIFTKKGTLGQTGLVPEGGKYDQYLLSSNQMKLTVDPLFADPLFVYYFVSSPESTEKIIRDSEATGVPKTNVTYLREFPITLPPLPEQRAIAHILGTLDDKIELNRRMNETLEEMARALFKSWFIDFDPVHAKAVLRRHAAAQITPPLRGSRQDKGDSPQASRWGDHAAPHPPRRWAEIKRQYSPQTLQRAQALRQNQTNAEGLLWHYLSRKQLAGYRFRRQQPIGPYIADFACLSEKLLIELDGGQHAEQTASDNRRDRFLQEKGYRVLRFWNHEVFENCFGVLESIYAALPHHPPLDGGSKDNSLSGRGSPPPPQPAPNGLASATPPPGGSDWSVERARAYLDGMDPGIAALFPDRFVDSELGEIPEGWEIKALGELAEVTSGKRPRLRLPTVTNEVKVPVWGGNGPMAFTRDSLIDQPVLITGRVGTLGAVFRVTSPCWPSDNTLVVKPRHRQAFEFLFFHMQRIDFTALNRGSTQPLLTQTDIKAQRLALPSSTSAILERFSKSAAIWYARLDKAEREIQCLSLLRDTLLPRLVSGELRVKNADHFIGEAKS